MTGRLLWYRNILFRFDFQNIDQDAKNMLVISFTTKVMYLFSHWCTLNKKQYLKRTNSLTSSQHSLCMKTQSVISAFPFTKRNL